MKSYTLCHAALALTLGVGSTAYAQEFSQTVFFGDSLTDSGRMHDTIYNSLAYYVMPTTYPSFTTNHDTTWAAHLAKSYGHKADAKTSKNPNGSNYAVGGARVEQPVSLLVLTIPSVKQQINDYLTKHNQADPNALYTVWVGANDLLEADKILKQDGSKTAQALNIIDNAATAQADLIENLHQSGANYILVPNIPDVGLTPRNVNNHNQSAQATYASQRYNQKLYRSLSTKDANVIAANTFALLQEAIGDKQAFGFKNVDDVACTNLSSLIGSLACDESEWKSPTANEDYAFADDIHPSGRTHRLLAQYYQSLINAPDAISQIPTKLIEDGNQLNQQLNRRLSTLGRSNHSVWIDSEVSNARLWDSSNNKPNLALGLDTVNQNHRTGFYLRYNKQNHQINTLTSTNFKQLGFGLYHHHAFGQAQLKASAGIDRIQLNTYRKIAWEGAEREHDAHGAARRFHANLQGSYDIALQKATFSPFVGVQAQKVRINDLSENQNHLSTALRFHEQAQSSLQGQIGINWQYTLSNQAQLFAGIQKNREFNKQDRTITTSVSSIADYTRGFSLPANQDSVHDSLNVHLGTQLKVNDTHISIGVNSQKKNEAYDFGGFLGVQNNF